MTTVPGIDVSRYQGTVNWKAVADAGYRFAVVRATIWNAKIDETFETNWNGARNAGLLVSAYHVVKADVTAAAQIDFLAQALAEHNWDLPPVLDIERDDKLSTQQITQCSRDCLHLSEQRFGRKPIVYTAKWFWNSHVSSSAERAQYDLFGHMEIQPGEIIARKKVLRFFYPGNIKKTKQNTCPLDRYFVQKR